MRTIPSKWGCEREPAIAELASEMGVPEAPAVPACDPVNRPAHYTAHPSGIECIQVTEHMGFNLGNAVKYIWRCDLKRDAIEDLEKARWYIDREISTRRAKAASSR